VRYLEDRDVDTNEQGIVRREKEREVGYSQRERWGTVLRDMR